MTTFQRREVLQMAPRKELKAALANELALLYIYKNYFSQDYPEVEKAFQEYAKETEGRLLELRRLLHRYCGG